MSDDTTPTATTGTDIDTAATLGDQLGVCLVTGAAGFLGSHLAAALALRGCDVRALARRDLPDELAHLPGVTHVLADLRDPDAVAAAVAGADTIFATASVVDLACIDDTEALAAATAANVDTARVLVDAARAAGVRRIVYTSSNTAVDDGAPHVDLDESVPYPTSFADVYAKTKSEAEQLMLAADGTDASDDVLRTVALRPGQIYGPGDPHFIPKVVEAVASGMLLVRLGDPDAKADLGHVDDMVAAHIAAARRLADPATADTVGGHAYFVNDGEPRNFFDQAAPAVRAIGRRLPRVSLPNTAVLAAARLAERRYLRARGAGRDVAPPFLRTAEVEKLGRTYFHSNAAARRDLGWAPTVELEAGMTALADELLAYEGSLDAVEWAPPRWWLALGGGMLALTLLAARRSPVSGAGGLLAPVRMRRLLAAAAAVHVAEAAYAWRTASAAGLHRSRGAWAAQTLAIGFPSLVRLRRRADLRRRFPTGVAR